MPICYKAETSQGSNETVVEVERKEQDIPKADESSESNTAADGMPKVDKAIEEVMSEFVCEYSFYIAS